MTTIDPSALAAIFRRQVRSLARPSSGSAAAAVRSGGHAPPGAAPAASGHSARDVASLVAHRVQAIDPADPDRQRKAFRVFLESVLIAEFGDGLVNDPGFHRLVDDVHGDMNADPELSRSIAEAAERMLAAR